MQESYKTIFTGLKQDTTGQYVRLPVVPSYIHRYKNPFFFQYQNKNFSANARLLSSAKKANAGDDVKASDSKTNGTHSRRNQVILSSLYCFLRKEHTLFKTLCETFQLRYHLLSTLQDLLLSVSIRQYTAKAAKVNSSCNLNWLPPTQGHSLWTSHSPYSRLTLNTP